MYQSPSILSRPLRLLGQISTLNPYSDLNDVRTIKPTELGGYGIDAQWSDDFHHAVNAFFRKSQWGYFVDFGKIGDIAKAIQEGFVYDGRHSIYRKKRFGSSSVARPGEQFVITIQNHDQVGNASRGQRLSSLLDEKKYRLASMLMLLAPNLPLLFMGQEWATTSPFLYFTSFEDNNLAQNVYEGYLKEQGMLEERPGELNPQNPERFFQSKLNWQELESAQQQSMFGYYQALIKLRKQLPCLANCRKDLTRVRLSEEEKWLLIERKDPHDPQRALLVANLSDEDRTLPLPPGDWKLLLSSSQESSKSWSAEVNLAPGQPFS